ncbi:hypothetical protein DFA_05121 [Cavenderia fasciculata]|uniref:Uncharacterized protein n=1 Tax=Cavenderia fasciculata TaxID=261658 RepID=F4PND8_CACFS|nr:uncharacterized protein DFA_05121 [Cavenderia fasciculata]EGG22991.1 hypothetical protein DFA_05121 [Cavenderia fasciculata]|eukprot:XP_004360842.1 hypothetical protein DFA_05121 [Cavenderia fasciculata]
MKILLPFLYLFFYIVSSQNTTTTEPPTVVTYVKLSRHDSISCQGLSQFEVYYPSSSCQGNTAYRCYDGSPVLSVYDNLGCEGDPTRMVQQESCANQIQTSCVASLPPKEGIQTHYYDTLQECIDGIKQTKIEYQSNHLCAAYNSKSCANSEILLSYYQNYECSEIIMTIPRAARQCEYFSGQFVKEICN